jgi:hypothetical protein
MPGSNTLPDLHLFGGQGRDRTADLAVSAELSREPVRRSADLPAGSGTSRSQVRDLPRFGSCGRVRRAGVFRLRSLSELLEPWSTARRAHCRDARPAGWASPRLPRRVRAPRLGGLARETMRPLGLRSSRGCRGDHRRRSATGATLHCHASVTRTISPRRRSTSIGSSATNAGTCSTTSGRPPTRTWRRRCCAARPRGTRSSPDRFIPSHGLATYQSIVASFETARTWPAGWPRPASASPTPRPSSTSGRHRRAPARGHDRKLSARRARKMSVPVSAAACHRGSDRKWPPLPGPLPAGDPLPHYLGRSIAFDGRLLVIVLFGQGGMVGWVETGDESVHRVAGAR